MEEWPSRVLRVSTGWRRLDWSRSLEKVRNIFVDKPGSGGPRGDKAKG